MTDQTEPTCPYCAEDVLAIVHFRGALSERDRTRPRIEALEAERDRLRKVIQEAHSAMSNSMDADAFAILSAALKREGGDD